MRTIEELFYACQFAGEVENQITKDESARLDEWFKQLPEPCKSEQVLHEDFTS